MKESITKAEITFDERNVPISTRFDDPYFSFQNGLKETDYVFIEGNDLHLNRIRDGFHVGELGFGSGLNFFRLWKLAQKRKALIKMTSFEAFPLNREDRLRSLKCFPTMHNDIRLFHEGFDGREFNSQYISLTVIIGDARKTLKEQNLGADAWFLDGFSPSKNPELWEAPLMQSVFENTKPTGTIATYTAAGFVRANLAKAGFIVERVKGFGHKRHMTRGYRP